jgi:predicted acetyltransferase
MIAREILVPVADKATLAAMLRDYIAEMATIIPGVDPEQPYAYFDLYWSEPNSRWPFWLVADGAKAGFALLAAATGTMRIAEFFVARPYRRQTIGKAAARRLIARHPGRWQITQREANTGGIAFWHRVLDGFVNYDEATTHTDAVRRQQVFSYASASR